MLANLDNVNWEELHCPLMPNWIRKLTSAKHEEREEAFNSLYDSKIDHLSDASPYVIPFLIELLDQDEVQQKDAIALLIMQLASEASAFREQEQHSRLAEHVLDEVTKGIDAYLMLLERQETIDVTLELLAFLTQVAERSVPRILPLLSEPCDEKTRVRIIHALGVLITNNQNIANRSAYIESLTQLLSPQESSHVRVVAGAAIVKILKEQTPQQVVEVIIEAFLDPKPCNLSVSNVALSLSQLNINDAVTALIRVLSHLRDPYDSFEVLPIVLNLGFNNGILLHYNKTLHKANNTISGIYFRPVSECQTKVSTAEGLTDIQIRILAALTQNELIWRFQTDIFSQHGLSDSRDELMKLIQ